VFLERSVGPSQSLYLHNTTQHNTIQYNTIQYNTTQHNTTQLRRPWLGSCIIRFLCCSIKVEEGTQLPGDVI